MDKPKFIRRKFQTLEEMHRDWEINCLPPDVPRFQAVEMKKAGLLKDATDPAELAKRAWLDLDGVTDAWIKDLKVEKVAGGGRPTILDPRGFAGLFEGRKGCLDSCCIVE